MVKGNKIDHKILWSYLEFMFFNPISDNARLNSRHIENTSVTSDFCVQKKAANLHKAKLTTNACAFRGSNPGHPD